METVVAALTGALALVLTLLLVGRRRGGEPIRLPLIAGLVLVALAAALGLAGSVLGWPAIVPVAASLGAIAVFDVLALRDLLGYAWSGASGRQAAGTGMAALGAVMVEGGGAVLLAGLPVVRFVVEWLGLAGIAVGVGLAALPLASEPLSRKALARRRFRSAAVGIGSAMLGIVLLIVSLPIAPWAMGIVGNVKYSYTTTIPAENKGTYLVTDDGVMQLYSWYVQPSDVPADTPVLKSTRVHAVAFVQKQFSDLSAYQLYDVDNGTLLAWGSATKHGMQMVVQLARPLPAGQYMLTVPQDSMFGGQTWQFFTIE